MSTPETTYTGKQNRALRAQAHHLKPRLRIGHEGITSQLLAQLQHELEAHHLVKVKLAKKTTDRKAVAQQLAEQTGAHVAQLVGRIVLLYRPKSTLEQTEKKES